MVEVEEALEKAFPKPDFEKQSPVKEAVEPQAETTVEAPSKGKAGIQSNMTIVPELENLDDDLGIFFKTLTGKRMIPWVSPC